MKDNELDQLLKSVPAPGRADGYWNGFPKRVTAKIHWQSQKSDLPTPKLSHKTKQLAVWGLSLATACIIVGFISGLWRRRDAGLDAGQLAQARKYYNEIEGLFPNQVQAIVFDRQGPHLVLADKADVPSSPPFYVKVCGPKGCQGFITFSGQQIQVNGEICEVLADDHGGIMLVGNNRVWFGSESSGPIRVEVRPLAVVL